MAYSDVVTVNSKGEITLPIITDFFNSSTAGGRRAKELVMKLYASDFKRYGLGMGVGAPHETPALPISCPLLTASQPHP